MRPCVRERPQQQPLLALRLRRGGQRPRVEDAAAPRRSGARRASAASRRARRAPARRRPRARHAESRDATASWARIALERGPAGELACCAPPTPACRRAPRSAPDAERPGAAAPRRAGAPPPAGSPATPTSAATGIAHISRHSGPPEPGQLVDELRHARREQRARRPARPRPCRGARARGVEQQRAGERGRHRHEREHARCRPPAARAPPGRGPAAASAPAGGRPTSSAAAIAATG